MNFDSDASIVGTFVPITDADRQALREALVAEHLAEHLTDGRWHDDCTYCLARRERGGTGVRD